MSENSVNNARIAKNTMLLYFRMILLMLISLYTSRKILEELGVEDYGIYNIVSGFIVMLSFINGAISSSTSRYITFALGRNDDVWLKKVFSTCLQSHVVISVLILIIGETVGLWIVKNVLVIPSATLNAALWVYQCSIISTVIMVWSVPFNACIIAHERMSAFAYISVFESIAKLLIVFALGLVESDRLILYAVLLLLVQVSISGIYVYYGFKNFQETKSKLLFEKGLFKETMSYAGWSLWGGLAAALFTQGVNFVLNIFFGPVVNAARGLAVTVQSSVQQFSSNFQTALNPQITKAYASNLLNEMHVLIIRSSKFTFFLIFCLSLPIILETKFVLDVWLKEIPEYTVSFVRIMLVICIIDAMANPFMTAIAATGRVKKYHCLIGGILLTIVPIAYISLYVGGAPISVFYVQLIIFIVAFVVRLIFVATMIGLSISRYLREAIVPCLIIVLFSVIPMYLLQEILPENFITSLMIMCISFVLVLILSYCIGLTKGERFFIINKFSHLIGRIN